MVMGIIFHVHRVDGLMWTNKVEMMDRSKCNGISLIKNKQILQLLRGLLNLFMFFMVVVCENTNTTPGLRSFVGL